MPTWYLAGTERFRGPAPAAAVVAGSDPPGIFGANLIAWWDGDTAIGGGLPSGVAPDLSGHSHPLTASGSTIPTIGTLNGFPSYQFASSGSATGILSAGSVGSLSFPGLGAAGAVFAVISVGGAAGTAGRIFSCDVGANDFDNLNGWTGNVATSGNALNVTLNNVNTATSSAWTIGENIIVCFAFDVGNVYVYKNNVQIGSTGAVGGTVNIGGGAGGGSTTFSLGNASTLAGTACFQGQIGAAFVVNLTPNSTQLTAGYNYLKTKFGL